MSGVAVVLGPVGFGLFCVVIELNGAQMAATRQKTALTCSSSEVGGVGGGHRARDCERVCVMLR